MSEPAGRCADKQQPLWLPSPWRGWSYADSQGSGTSKGHWGAPGLAGRAELGSRLQGLETSEQPSPA